MSGAERTATSPLYDASLPPEYPELHAKHVTLAQALQPEYWQQLNPGLHVGDEAFVEGCKPFKPSRQRLSDLASQINEAGVAQVGSRELPWTPDLDQLAAAVVNLVRHGWPPSLLVVYDEVWAMVRQASAVMKEATGGNTCNMDILAWLVDPNRGDVGFSPHRDRQPDDAPSTFRPDGSAMYATLWVPLTHATPENSCLYIIPRCADPGYFEGDPEEEGAPDPLTAALPNKEAYQHIRALPAEPGAAVLFTHRTIHWGSKGRVGCPTPRISISWGCADDAYEPSYFSRHHLPCPSLDLRLALAGAQMIIYHERFPAPPKQLCLYYQAFTAQAPHFDSSYRSKVQREFVDASKEATAAAAGAASGTPGAPRAETAAVAGRSSGPSAAQPHSSADANGDTAAGAAGAGGRSSKKGKKRKKVQQEAAAVGGSSPEQPEGVPAAGATAPARSEVSARHSKQRQRLEKRERTACQQQQQPKVKEKGAAAATPADAAALQQPQGTQDRKQRKHKDKPAAAAAVGTGANGVGGQDSEDEGPSIDWALLAAQARSHRQHNAAAAAAAAEDGDEGDDDDVMELALEAMLDGDGAFADDYDDD